MINSSKFALLKQIRYQTNLVWYGHTYSRSMDQLGKVLNPGRGQLNKETNFSLSAFAPENLVSRRVRQSRPVSACSSPYSG